jgi:hypothetical protein
MAQAARVIRRGQREEAALSVTKHLDALVNMLACDAVGQRLAYDAGSLPHIPLDDMWLALSA